MTHAARFSSTLAFAALYALIAAPLALTQPTTAACPDASVSLAAYDVTSVKPASPERHFFVGAQNLPDGISGEAATVAMLIQSAFSNWNLPADDAITGLPDWAKADYFSVQAKMSTEQVAAFKKLDKDQQQACRRDMLLALLADRFKLKLHHESRQVLAYELVVAKGGPKMQEGAPNGSDVLKASNGKLISMQMYVSNDTEHVTAQAFSMDQLAQFLTRAQAVGHTVVDKTGLTGKYSFTLSFGVSGGVGPATAPGDAAAPDPAPTIFNALEDQLGLRLQRGTGSVDTLVIDHIDHSTMN